LGKSPFKASQEIGVAVEGASRAFLHRKQEVRCYIRWLWNNMRYFGKEITINGLISPGKWVIV
jgi:hypothetical protein